jgi:hypothetical protein
MGELGVCLNIKGLGEGLWSVDDLAELGVLNGWIRTPVQGSLNMLDSLFSLPPSLNVLVMLNNECDEVGPDWSGWESAVTTLRDQFGGRVNALACGNELDLHGVPHEFAAELVHKTLPILAGTGIRTIATSVTSSDWANYLERLSAACGDQQPDFYDAHLYGQRFSGLLQNPSHGNMAEAIQTALARTQGRPLVLSEGGVKMADVGGAAGQETYVTRWVEMVRNAPAHQIAFGTFFALYDEVGAGIPEEQGEFAFGLISHRDLGRQQRPAFNAFRNGL